MWKIRIRVAPLVVVVVAGLAWTTLSFAHRPRAPKTPEGAFEQLDVHGLRSPNSMRTASGAPGPEYWQQRVDYVIDVTLDVKNQRVIGSEEITYRNNSPDSLPYLWVQLDQNRFRTDSEDMRSMTVPSLDAVTYDELDMLLERDRFEGGAEILGHLGPGIGPCRLVGRLDDLGRRQSIGRRDQGRLLAIDRLAEVAQLALEGSDLVIAPTEADPLAATGLLIARFLPADMNRVTFVEMRIGG